MKKLVGAVVLALAFSAAPSEAAIIGTTPGPGDPFPNNVFPAEVEGWYGANLWLSAGPAGAMIEIIFEGKEASFTDRFFLNGVQYINNQTTTVGSVATVNVLPGVINFHFTINGAAGPTNLAPNPLPSTNLPNYFVTLGGPLDTNINGSTPSSGQQAWIALDDGGAGPDDNHDDLVVRLRITGGSFQVPDGGATLTLLGCALIGLGALRRRFGA